jgi:hypothetical protein
LIIIGLSNICELKMKLTFLCSDCRRWLTKNPTEIPKRCLGSYEWAGTQFQAGDLDKALNGIGTAFEMSEIMLKSDEICDFVASDWLVATSEELVRVLSELGRLEDSINIHRRTSVLLAEAGDNNQLERLRPKLERIARVAHGSNNYLRVVH